MKCGFPNGTELDFEITPKGYVLKKALHYFSVRFKKWVYVEAGFISDGATGAEDIVSLGWWIHDKLRKTLKWEDGTPCSNYRASCVLHDILLSEGRWFRARSWFIATLLFGNIKEWLKGKR